MYPSSFAINVKNRQNKMDVTFTSKLTLPLSLAIGPNIFLNPLQFSINRHIALIITVRRSYKCCMYGCCCNVIQNLVGIGVLIEVVMIEVVMEKSKLWINRKSRWIFATLSLADRLSSRKIFWNKELSLACR